MQAAAAKLFVQNLTIDGATGIGLVLADGAFADGSSGLTIKNSGSYPLFVKAKAIGTVPSGTYATNAIAAVLVDTTFTSTFSGTTRITSDATIHTLDVPYSFGTGYAKTDLFVSTVDSGPPTFASIPLVTIEPGVIIRFPRVTFSGAAQSAVNVDSGPDNGVWKPLGALKALGTASAPIVFTSGEASPAAGDWMSIILEELDPRTQLDHVEIAYAGANAGALGACNTGSPTAGGNSPFDGDAALQLFLHASTGPGRSPITNSSLHDSAGGGIYRAWDTVDLDLTASNTFSNIAWCGQTPIRIGSACVPATCN
jgi:hypothetical protein